MTINKIVCDLCGQDINNGGHKLSITPIDDKRTTYNRIDGYDNTIDVCKDCLEKMRSMSIALNVPNDDVKKRVYPIGKLIDECL